MKFSEAWFHGDRGEAVEDFPSFEVDVMSRAYELMTWNMSSKPTSAV